MSVIVDPTGRPVSAAPSDVVDLTQKGAITLANFHMLAQQFDWSIRCERCGQPVQGQNTTSDTKFLSVQCKCREYRCEAKGLAGRI